ncbi:transcriptional regulator, partial [Streptomyces sp. NPDC058953]
ARATGLVAAATVLILFLLSAFEYSPSFREGPVGRERATAPRGTGTPAVPAVPSGSAPGPSASPSSSASPRDTAAGPPARPSAAAGPRRTGSATAPRKSPAASEPPGGAAPFIWSVDHHVWAADCNHAYIVDRPPAAVPPPPAMADSEAWARALGAVHKGDTLIRVTVQGRGERTVALRALRVRIADRRPPQRRNVYWTGPPCGGALAPRSFAVDLDATRPSARPMPGYDSGAEIPAVSFPYRVSARDPEVLLVVGRTVNCDCDWYLELGWSSGDRSGTVRIDDAGLPFRTSGVRDGPAYLYDDGTRRWVPADGGGGGEDESESESKGEGTRPHGVGSPVVRRRTIQREKVPAADRPHTLPLQR